MQHFLCSAAQAQTGCDKSLPMYILLTDQTDNVLLLWRVWCFGGWVACWPSEQHQIQSLLQLHPRGFSPLWLKQRKRASRFQDPEIKHRLPQETLACKVELTKPLGQRYCEFVYLSDFCSINTNHFFCLAPFFYQMAVMSCLQRRSVIRPHDQRTLLSSAENFKTKDNKQFEKASWASGPGLFYLARSLAAAGFWFSSRMEHPVLAPATVRIFYLFWSKSHGVKTCFHEWKKRKKLFHLPTTSHLGWDLASAQASIRCGSQLAGEAGSLPPTPSAPCTPSKISTEADIEAYMKRPGAAGEQARV